MKKIMVRKGILFEPFFVWLLLELPDRPTPGGSFEVLLRTHYWLRLWKEALLPTAFLSIFVVEPRSLMVETTRMSRERKWIGAWLVSKWGKFHLLTNGIYWGYKPLILTFRDIQVQGGGFCILHEVLRRMDKILPFRELIFTPFKGSWEDDFPHGIC